MDSGKKNELKKYLFPPIGGLLMGIFWLVIGIAGMGAVAVPGGFLLVALVFAVISSWKCVADIGRMNEQIKEWEDNGRLERVLQEFETGKQFLGDKVRLGPTYIIGKKSGQVYTYDEIKKIYQYVHKTNFAEDQRELRGEMMDGETRMICKLPLHGKGNEELMQVVGLIKVMNPNVQVGYK